MLRVVMGTDWVCVRDEMLNRIAQDVAHERGNRVYMVPELISHDTERRLCVAAGDTTSRFAEVLSFTRLAGRVAESCAGQLEPCLDNGGRVAAMAAAARQLASRLKVYASVETRPEFLTEMVNVVDEFKRCCITSEDLHAASEEAEGSFAQKLEDLSLLLGAYDALCAQGKRDPRDRETQLLEQLQDGDFGEKHVFYIDGFPDFTRQHLAILQHLIRVSPQVTVGINCDRLGSKRMAFEKAADTAGALIHCAKRAGIEYIVEVLPRCNDLLTQICDGLYQGNVPLVEDGTLAVLRCESIHDEVTVAAEQVARLVQAGSRYRDISIVCGDMGSYQNVVDMVFHRFGIPIYQSGTEDVLQKTVINTVISALEAALGGFEQRDVMRYLKSVLSPLEQDECDRVENYAIMWGIQGKMWTNAWTAHPKGLNAPWNPDATTRLQQLNDARQRAMKPLVRLRQGFAEAENCGQQVCAVYTFLEDIHLAQRLDTLAQQQDAQGDNRSAQILNQLWEILIGTLEQLYDLLGVTAWEPENFTRLFALVLSQYHVGTIPPVLDSVTVGPVSAMRCQQCRHLIVLGASEGMLPGYGGSKGLLTDQERVALRKLGVPLTGGAMDGIQAEFAEIYGVFCGARESITVLCGGSQPSFVYRRLAQMCGGEVLTAPTLGAAVLNEQEAAAYLAKWEAWDAATQLNLQECYTQIRRGATYEFGTISRENIDGLYGSKLRLSASQIDTLAQCRMAYFLKYGLLARERKEAVVDAAEFGTYIHAVLEKTARKVMDLGGFHQVSLEETLQLAMEFSDEYATQHYQQMESQRLSYLFRRNLRELEMVVEELWKELKNSSFLPEDFELRFGDDGQKEAIDIHSGAIPAALIGFVDRVDVWKEKGRHYFRVVDYKTGKKDFDYCDIFNGVGLQMLLYLFALEQGDFGIGAGVQYFPARVPLINVDGKLTPEEAQQRRQKEWKRKGLLLDDEQVLDAMDPEDWQRLCAEKDSAGNIVGDVADRGQMKLLHRYLVALIGRLVDDIASGNVQANPYTRGSSYNACTFCPYGSICHEEHVQMRRNYKAMKSQRFWEEVTKEVNRHG